MEWRKCKCGVKFWGAKYQEDTCRHYLKRLLKQDDYEMLARENKAMADKFLQLGYTDKQISDICNGAI